MQNKLISPITLVFFIPNKAFNTLLIANMRPEEVITLLELVSELSMGQLTLPLLGVAVSILGATGVATTSPIWFVT